MSTPDQNSNNNDDEIDQSIWEKTFQSMSDTIAPHSHSNHKNPPSPPQYLDCPLDAHYPPYSSNIIKPIQGNLPVSFSHPSFSSQRRKKIFAHPFKPDMLLDLHHLSTQEAYLSCQYAISQCQQAKLRKLHLICGQGHHSKGLSKLKGICILVLSHSPSILAYQSAHPSCGGTGAIDVFLRKPTKT
ncbi:MAG: Smr/MutS family protein [Pseudomonadota bacterium]|nr:Smr/MutS family protein [Pseudomonadota bacterium]